MVGEDMYIKMSNKKEYGIIMVRKGRDKKPCDTTGKEEENI